MNKKVWYTSPAQSFTEALPLGNGNLGAMVYGRIPCEHITLNYDTFWSGTGTKDEKKIPIQALTNVRKLIMDKEYWEAERYIKDNMLGQYNESYMPMGIIDYTFTDITEYKDYKRTLDLENAVLTTEFTANDRFYKTEMFVSYVDKVFVIKISCDRKTSLNMNIALSSKVRHKVQTCEETSDIFISGRAPSHVQPNYIMCSEAIQYDDDMPGMAFCGSLRVKQRDGRVIADPERIYIEQASEVIMYAAVDDGYTGFQNPISSSEKKCITKCKNTLDTLYRKEYDYLKTRHVNDYQRVCKNVSIDLGEEEPNLPTNIRLENFRKGKEDLGLYCLFFHYNRYLLISSSRNETQPANLQGIWSESLRPVWSSNWTININTQMNYWPACSCNLPECYGPLVAMLEELSIAGQQTAKNQYHCRGWAANHNVDLWRQTGPVGGEPKYAYWPMGGVWLSAQIYDYYRYTLDTDSLRERIFPIMQGAVEFCLDWLVLGEDGIYNTVPSTSPENTFFDDAGRVCGVSYSSTLDIGLIKELFSNYMEACSILEIRNKIYDQVIKHLNHMPQYQIGKNGELQEWIYDFEETDPGHRHFSPLFAFHPGHTIQKGKEIELTEACKKFIQRKELHQSSQIGWSCAWLINLWARLGDGDKALFYLRQLLESSVYDNLFDLHPPLGESEGEREVFQIDGNFGSASGVAAMLLNSSLGDIELLPALPDKWKNGSAKGLLAEGNVTIDIKWENSKLQSAELFSPIAQRIKLHSPAAELPKEIDMKKNIPFLWKSSNQSKCY